MGVYYITIITTMFTSILAQLTGKRGKNNIIVGKKSYNKFFIFLTGIILILVAGLRWQVGTDYWQYSINYNRYIVSFWSDIKNFNEPGINVIAKLSSLIYDDYATMFFIASMITIGLMVRTISKYSNYFTFSILLYIFIGAWHGSFNGIRQYLACAIIFAGHYYIIEKKFLKYLFVVLIASLFHISALVMVVLYFVPKKKLKFKYVILMLIIAVIVIYSYDLIFNIIEIIKGDLTRDCLYCKRKVNILRVLISFAPLMVYYALTEKKLLKTKDIFYINILFVNAIFVLAAKNSAYLMRFAIYTKIFSVLSFPRLINFKDKHLRIMIKYIIIVLYAIFWYAEISSGLLLKNFYWIFER